MKFIKEDNIVEENRKSNTNLKGRGPSVGFSSAVLVPCNLASIASSQHPLPLRRTSKVDLERVRGKEMKSGFS